MIDTTETALDWRARFAAHAEMYGDEWDAEEERLKRDWLSAYEFAFVEIAVNRGWSEEDAETWPDEIGEEAYINSYQHGRDPRRSAESDVIACEEPA